ncbi:hypothetical protein GQ44DRAFT_773045 [Phaeosphaeriaceae sp. PMI808]|nr:hypothetical protein GQ44DRAFT_773045 [Phaeosphaeriaceae sp. PMI808]
MISSYSTFSLAPSFPMKFIPYIPRASKPGPESKAHPISTTKTVEHSHSGAGSPKEDRDWFHTDDFLMPDSNTSRSLNPGVPTLLRAIDASSSLDYNAVSSLSAASELEKLGHYQPSRDSLNGGGTDHTTSVVKTNSTINGLFDGSSLEFPLILESDAAEEHHSTTQVKPSN